MQELNEHEKAGNKLVLNWIFLSVNGKAKRALKKQLSKYYRGF